MCLSWCNNIQCKRGALLNIWKFLSYMNLVFSSLFIFWTFYKTQKLKQILSSFKGIFLWFLKNVQCKSIYEKLCNLSLSASFWWPNDLLVLNKLHGFIYLLNFFFNLIVEEGEIWILNVFIKNTKKYQLVELQDYWPIVSI